MADKTHAEHLREMIEGAEARMLDDKCSDQNYAVLGRMRNEFLIQLAAIPGEVSTVKPASAVDEFTQRRQERDRVS